MYLEENKIKNPFLGNIPGKDSWTRFKKRWPCISERKPQHLSKKRHLAAYPDIVNDWFDTLEELMHNLRLDPHSPETAQRLWNCDETGLCTAVSAKSLLVRRGTKQVNAVSSGSDYEYITVQTACSASGVWLPPFILYKGKNLYQQWMTGGLTGARYGVSESGWMDTINFLSWFTRHFIPAVKHLTDTGPVPLLFDGHYSHISLELIRQAKQHNVHLACLPPNTTHLLQPLDVSVFAILKNSWRKILKQYHMETQGGNYTKEIYM